MTAAARVLKLEWLLCTALLCGSSCEQQAGERTGISGAAFPAGDLDLPRGLAIDADGTLLIADSGSPDEGHAGRIIRLGPDGRRTLILNGIHNVRAPGGWVTGVSGVIGGAQGLLVTLGSGAWIERPLLEMNRLVRITSDGDGEVLFDFARYEQDWNPDGGAIDSSAAAVGAAPDSSLWVVDSAGNWAAHLDPSGKLLAAVAFPTVAGAEAVPTSVSVGPNGDAYVTLFRCQIGHAGGVARVRPDGSWQLVAEDLSTPIGTALSPTGDLYVLTYAQRYAPASGQLFVLHPDGGRSVIRGNLNFPTALTVDKRGSIYVAESMAPEPKGRSGRIIVVEAP